MLTLALPFLRGYRLSPLYCLCAHNQGRALPAQVLSETGSATIESQAGERGKQGDREEVAGRKPDLRATWREFSALRAEAVAPSLWWIPGVPAVQILLFATNAMAVRSMAVQQWPGFATEGELDGERDRPPSVACAVGFVLNMIRPLRLHSPIHNSAHTFRVNEAPAFMAFARRHDL
jgi:hypothetical protein